MGENKIMSNKILSPTMLWDKFNDSLPLKETVLNSETIGNAIFNYVYFSGRQVSSQRVRIYGVYAEQKNTQANTIVILPDVSGGIDIEIITHFVNLGYNVLSVDLAGKVEGKNDFTVYPDKVSYANYEQKGKTFDFIENSAKETCWYEWCAVSRYAVSYAKSKNPDGKIGLIGINYGANVAWQLTAIDNRVNASAFIFGAGWMAYKGVYKNLQEEIPLDNERLKFIAGIDAHSYAQFVKVPVLYLGSTNNEEFDSERAIDTLQRVDNQGKSWFYFVNNSVNVLDKNSLQNIEIFFDKFISSKDISLPSTPKISIECDEESISYYVNCSNFEEIESVEVFASSNDMALKNRLWFVVPLEKELGDGEFLFKRRVYGFVEFEISYAVVKYKNGLTLSSKYDFSKVNVKSNSKIPSVIFSSSKLVTRFVVDDLVDNDLLAGVFSNENLYDFEKGPFDILGVSTKNTIISHAIKKFSDVLNDSSFVKFDAYTNVPDTITLTLTTENGFEYFVKIELLGQDLWQNQSINLTDFKTEIGMPIKDFSNIESITVTSLGSVLVNNFLIL